MAEPCTYTKLQDGSFGVRGPNLVAGATVEVTQRNGATRHETIDRVVGRGRDGLCIATKLERGATRQALPRPPLLDEVDAAPAAPRTTGSARADAIERRLAALEARLDAIARAALAATPPSSRRVQ